MSILIEDEAIKIHDVGVDWLTCSAAGGGIGSSFNALAVRTLEEEKKQGATVRPASFRGYTGLRGAKTFYGTSGRDALCILSGGQPLPLVREFIESATNVSRIDLQVTLQRTRPDLSLGRVTYLHAMQGGDNRGQKPIVTRIHNSKLGDTVSIGSRISDQYGRFYDKGIEAKLCEAGKLHRFEVEYKRTQALHVARSLVELTRPHEQIKSTVLAWWRYRGVDPMPGENGRSQIEILSQTRPRPDLLKWFETTVKQSVATAIRDYGLEQTLDSLGLMDALLKYKED